MGTKMMTSEMVVATTASVISLVASIAAVFGNSYFSSMNRTMFSSTTIASSMTMPTASVKPSNVMLLRVKSIALSSVNVAMTEVGIASDDHNRSKITYEQQDDQACQQAAIEQVF